MTVTETVKLIQAECTVSCDETRSFKTVYASDLLSDVLANAPDGCVMVTVQAHKNAVAVASMKNTPAIIVCNDRPVPQDMIDAAEEEHIGVYVTPLDQFHVSGLLYERLAAEDTGSAAAGTSAQNMS